MIPEIVTSRLRLRAHRIEDFPASAAMWGDREIATYIGGRPLSEEETWARFLRYSGHWTVMGFGYWLVEEQATGAFVGEVGFADWKREIQPSIQGIPELGWVFAKRAQGKGYATEAALAAIEWSRANLPSPSICCLIHPENVASIRVADKCRFRRQVQTTYRHEPIIIFTRENS